MAIDPRGVLLRVAHQRKLRDHKRLHCALERVRVQLHRHPVEVKPEARDGGLRAMIKLRNHNWDVHAAAVACVDDALLHKVFCGLLDGT